MQIQIHQRCFIGCRYNLIAIEGFIFQKLLLLTIQRIVFGIGNVRLCRKEETARSTAGISDGSHRLWTQTRNHCFDKRTRREVLSGAALDVFCVFLEQALIDFAFDIRGHGHPFFIVDHLHDTIQYGCFTDFIGRTLENLAENAALLAELFQGGFILLLQLCALERMHICPCKTGRNSGISLVGRSGIFV